MSFIDKQKEKIDELINGCGLDYEDRGGYPIYTCKEKNLCDVCTVKIDTLIVTNKEWCDEVVKSNLHYAIIEKLEDFKQWLEETEKGL